MTGRLMSEVRALVRCPVTVRPRCLEHWDGRPLPFQREHSRPPFAATGKHFVMSMAWARTVITGAVTWSAAW
eukprot:5530963-Lingulodinium_polyedra.AAC.1